MAKNATKVGRTIVLILCGAALGTLMGSGLSKYGLLTPLTEPILVLNFPLSTYVDFFFLSFSFGFTLKVTASTLIGGIFGYWITRRW